MKKLLRLLYAIFPDKYTCLACGGELLQTDRHGLCPECKRIMPKNDGHICMKCGKPMLNEAEYCLGCQNSEMRFSRARSPLIYDGKARELLYGFKFNGRKYYAKYFASYLVDEYLDESMECDVVTFVPSSVKRRRERGYNQGETLAKIFAERMKLPCVPAMKKVKDTPPQETLLGRERREAVKGAFQLTEEGKEAIKGKRVLLVDDVITTGATASECAGVLLKVASDVQALALMAAKYKLVSENLKEE